MQQAVAERHRKICARTNEDEADEGDRDPIGEKLHEEIPTHCSVLGVSIVPPRFLKLDGLL